jgi:hypothetical protein
LLSFTTQSSCCMKDSGSAASFVTTARLLLLGRFT